MELKPSPLAIAVFKIFERLDTEYSLNRPTQCKCYSIFITHIKWCSLFLMDFFQCFWIEYAVAEKDLLELYGIFGEQLQVALDIIDRDKITIFRRASDNRQYIEIVQQQNSIFKLLPNINYCMCADFREKVIATGQLYTCNHVLAAKLAVLLGKPKIETSNDDAFSFSLRMIRPVSSVVNPNTTANTTDIEWNRCRIQNYCTKKV